MMFNSGVTTARCNRNTDTVVRSLSLFLILSIITNDKCVPVRVLHRSFRKKR